MTTYAPPPTPTPPARPVQPAGGARRGLLLAAAAALVLAAGAAAFSWAMLVRPAPHAVHTLIMPPSAPALSGAEVAAAKERACDAWLASGGAIAEAGNAVADAPHGWDDPLKMAARGAQARTVLIEGQYLADQVDPATPADLAESIHEYLVATFDQEHATMQTLGTQVDTAIDRANAAVHKVNAACGLA
jgi:hypothetical protein